jgi:L-ascorbate metabolism protein UlaG (beta-lactamase superfamily)
LADPVHREADAAERTKELDFEHRRRSRGLARATLSLAFLRAAWLRSWTPTVPAASAPVSHPPKGSVALTFVGHATVMITTPAVRVLTDPMLENSLCGLRRAHAAAIDPQNLADVRLILISHAHRDHLNRRTLARLPKAATLVVPPQCASLVADLDFAKVIELGPGHTFSFADVDVVSVPARHSGVRGVLDRRRRGTTGYVLLTQGRTVYFAGDTGYFSGFAEIGRRFNPDMALLPIAGYQPAPFRQEHMSPLDAVYAFEDLGARALVPISYGSFELGYEPIMEPLTWLQELARERNLGAALTVLGHGQSCLLR